MQDASFRFNDFRLVTATRELWKGDARVAIPARVFACLCHLIEHRDRVVGRDELIAAVWHRDNVSDIQLGQLVLRARRAVDDEGSTQHSIRTAVGFGYHWIAPTDVESTAVDGSSQRATTDERSGDPQFATSDATVEESTAATIAAPVATSIAGQHRRRVPRAALFVAIAVVAAVIGAVVIATLDWHRVGSHPAQTLAATAHVAVLPLTTPANTDAAWARLGGMDLIADQLRRAGLAVAPSESVLSALRAAPTTQGSARGPLLRRALDTTLVVDGSVALDAGIWQVHLEASMPRNRATTVRARDADLLHALRAATDQLLTALGRSPPNDNDAGTPDVAALVQRVRAALLADDPATARDLIDNAPAPLRADAELRFLRAQTDARAGRFGAAENAFTALLATLGVADNPRMRMRVLSARGMARVRVGRIAEARQDFDTALSTPNADMWPVEFGLASNGRGIANVILHAFDAAAEDFGTARVQMERSGDVLGVARVDTNLGLLEYERGALSQAQSHLDSAVRRFEPLGAVRELSSALAGVQLVQLALLDDRGALATSVRLAAQVAHAGDPVQRRALRIRRAIALLANGYLRDAGAILDGIAAAPGADYHATRDDERVQTLRVELALDEGRDGDAALAAKALPSGPPSGGDDDLRAWSALLRQRLLGPTLSSESSATSILAPATPASRPLRALAQAEAEAAAGKRKTADPMFRNALSLAEQAGIPRLILSVVTAYAPRLLEEGRVAEAAALIGRTSVWADDDFDCALLQLRLAHASVDDEAWRVALKRARALAHERRIPVELTEKRAASPAA